MCGFFNKIGDTTVLEVGIWGVKIFSPLKKMSVTVIFGEPGVGKSSLCSYFAKSLYQMSGLRTFRDSCKKIEYLNAVKGFELTKPNRVPFFSDHEIKFQVGYKKLYSTYFLNGFYMALDNSNFESIYTPFQ